MKKLFLFLSALTLTLVSCSEEDEKTIGIEAVQFVSTASNFPVYQDFASSYVDVEVGVTTLSGSARTFSVTVDTDNSTATSSQYMLESSVVTIPADSYVGTVRVYGYYDQIAPGTEVELVLSLSEGSTVVTGKTTHTLTMYQACASNLVVMNIAFDGYGSEVAWELLDGSNNVLGSAAYGDYFDGQSSYSQEFCLDAGTYTFNVDDFYGDGLSFPSNGSITFTNTTTNTALGTISGDYGFGTSITFTIP